MKFDLIMSEKLGHDIYIKNNGTIWLKQHGNMHMVGTTGDHVEDIRKNVEQYV